MKKNTKKDSKPLNKMVVDESSTKVLFSHPISPKITEKELIDNPEKINRPINIQKKKIEKKPEKKTNKIILIIFIVILFIVLIGYFFLSKKFIINNIQRYAINSLITDDNEYISYKADIKIDGNELYNVLNKSHIDGSYTKETNKYKVNINLTTSYEETLNMFYYSNNESGYFYDPYFNELPIKLDKNYDLSISTLKKNIVSFLEQSIKNNMFDNFKLGYKYTTSVLSLKITKENIDKIISNLHNIKLDNIYQDAIDLLVTDMSDNKDKYINNSINIYSNFNGSVSKIEINSYKKIIIDINKDSLNINLVDNDKNYNLNILNNKILFTYIIGTRKDLEIDINYSYNKEHKDTINEIKPSDLLTNQYEIKKNILKNRSKLELSNLYYDIINKQSIINMSLENDDYVVFYLIPDKYKLSNYSGKTIKKYVSGSNTLTYNLKQNTNINEYILEQYDKDINSNLYKNVNKKESNELVFDDKNYNYQIITKSFDNFSDYNNKKSTLYLWYQIDDNNLFLIEYQFIGQDISEDEIKKLLVVQVG